MALKWQKAFSKSQDTLRLPMLSNFEALKQFLDVTHIKTCLLKPYFELPDYPLIEPRELLPSFETDVYEYKDLPGFSLVVLDRQLNYFQEIFQFDILHNPMEIEENIQGVFCPLEQTVNKKNINTMTQRLPRRFQEDFAKTFDCVDVTDLDSYPQALPFLLEIERAHVISRDDQGAFFLSGVYGSLPSDLETEIKRFGVRIGKFSLNDNQLYERNRPFVYQFFMELYGFPIVSERRTSCALFSRRLHRMDEKFMVRVLGQSDRTNCKNYPQVDKIALVQVDPNQQDVIRYLKKGKFFVDPDKRVVILRVRYQQHKYDRNNVQQERALSVIRQEVIHPLTGEICSHLNIVKDSSNMFLNLNDIVRGEYSGHIVYKRNEVVANTDTEEKRLKFLYAWLSKHQRRIIGYREEFYGNISKILDSYLFDGNRQALLQVHGELYRDVLNKYRYIQQARKVKYLENLLGREIKGKKITYLQMLQESREMLHELKFEIVSYFDELVANVISILETMLGNRYLRRNFIEKSEDELSDYGIEVRKNYRKLVALLDEFKSIRKSRAEPSPNKLLKAS